MDLDLRGLHDVAAYAAVLFGVVGPVLGLVYALRVDRRDFWRRPMLAGAVLSFVTTLTAYLSGHRLVEDHPRLLGEPGLTAELEFADRLLLPGAGFFVIALLTGVLNPHTGALKLMLPLLLTGFAVVVLALTVLGTDFAQPYLEPFTGQYQ